MAQIAADPGGVADGRPAVAAIGDTVADVLAQLTAALDAEGACWGDDEAGVGFAQRYLPAGAAVRQVLAEVAAGIHDVATTLAAVAGIFAVAEHDARAAWEVADAARLP